MLKVLVTAQNGQLGQCLQNIAPKYPNIKFIFKSSSQLDITNSNQVNSVFSSSDQFDYCINCAAYTAVDKAETEINAATEVNVLGVKYLAEACQKRKVTLVHVSTDFVFDGNASQPYTEESITNPLGIYGKTKLEGEKIITETLSNYFIIRTSWLYSEFGNNFLKTMLRLASERNEIGVVGDQIGSPTYAKDLAEIILNFIETPNQSFGLYHYSNEGSISWYDFAKAIFKITDSKVKLNKIETKDYPTAAVRPKFSVFNTSKITNTLGIVIPDWEASLSKAITNLNS